MNKWTIAQTTLRLGEHVRSESQDGHWFSGEVVAVTPSAARIKLSDGSLAFLPILPIATDGIFRLAQS